MKDLDPSSTVARTESPLQALRLSIAATTIALSKFLAIPPVCLIPHPGQGVLVRLICKKCHRFFEAPDPTVTVCARCKAPSPKPPKRQPHPGEPHTVPVDKPAIDA